MNPPTPALAPHRVRRRWTPVAAAAWMALAAGALGAQTLPLKTAVSGLEPFRCGPPVDPGIPAADERAQAEQLGGTARQAVVLGDLERARELLDRAVSLDASSPSLAYQHGRVLEDLGRGDEAVLEYCRALSTGASDEDARDARGRIEAYAEATRRRIPEVALQAFERGVAAYGEGRLPAALAAFNTAISEHPDFPEAVFNRGVVLERSDEPIEAADAFRRYLQLAPDAPDGIVVSERIGQLQVVPGALPSPGSALALGMLLPGGGQFYTGRPLGGISLLALAGGAAAAGLLIEEVDVRCLTPVDPGESCPPEQIIASETSRPYLTYGLAGAGALMLVGAIEAFVHARGLDEVEVAALGDRARLLGPSVRARGLGADVRFFRVTF